MDFAPHHWELGIPCLTVVKMLTKKRQRFVEEYLVELNATKAAESAGYSSKTARSQGQRLLTNVDIQEAIQVAMAARSERTQVNADDVFRELAQIAFSDMQNYATWGPQGVSIKESSELPPGASAAVMEVSETVSYDKDGGTRSATTKFKLHDKKGALDSLAKHLGMFVERAEVIVEEREPITQVVIFMPNAPKIVEGELGDGTLSSDPYLDAQVSLPDGEL